MVPLAPQPHKWLLQPNEWLFNAVPEPTFPALNVDLFACDLDALDEAKKQLTMAAAAIGAEQRSTCVVLRSDGLMRARGVANEVLCSSMRSDRFFDVRRRVASDDDVRATSTILAAHTGAGTALVWLDARGDRGFDAGACIAALASEFSMTVHFIVTCEKGGALDAFVASAESHADVHPIELVTSALESAATMSGMHEEIMVYMDEDDKRINLVERRLVSCMIEALKTAALSEDAPLLLHDGEMAGLYFGDDNAVFVRISIANVARIHALRDAVLSGDLSKALTRG